MLESTTEVCPFDGHDKAWKMHTWVILIFNDGMGPASLRSQQKSGKVNEFCW